MDVSAFASGGRCSAVRRIVLAGAFRWWLAILTIIAAATCGWAQIFSYLSEINNDVGRPTGLALDTIEGVTYLYVSDHDGGRVFRYNLADGSRVQLAARGTADGQFLWPDAIAIEPATHDLYIADRQLHRVTRLTNTGRFVMKWGDTGTQTNRFGHPGAGTAPGQFNAPVGVVIDRDGYLYTTEHENHRVQKFRVTRAGSSWNVETVATWGGGGSGPGQFNTPYGIALDAAGNVWVADGFNSRLQRFTPTGTLLGEIVVRRATEPHLVVTWVAFDPAGDLFASVTSDPNTGGNLANQRIEKFSAAGPSLGRWGTNGSAPGQFRLPFGIAIDRATNRAYIADYDNRRIQVFAIGQGNVNPVPPPPPVASTRLVNLASRQRIESADPSRGAMAGFVLGGTAQRDVLIRAVGPGLAGFGVADPMPNPRLQVFDAAGRLVAENDDWGGASPISSLGDRVGAFRVSADSRDAALVASLAPGPYTAQVVTGGGPGVVLLEVYDTPAAAALRNDRLVNLSARGFVDTTRAPLVAGFVVMGDTPKRVLLRGVGPGLAAFAVAGHLADPLLKLNRAGDGALLAQNDDWTRPQAGAATAAEIAQAAVAAGAFALGADSRDAALIATLPAGNYTAEVSGIAEGAGVALVEVFELP